MPGPPAPRVEDGPGIAVVIVNFRTMQLTAEAVRSVAAEPGVEEIVVVDNGSADGSAAFLRATFTGPRVRVVESPTNVGFGRGANLGASTCRAPLLFLLNSDAVVVPGALGKLAAVLVDDPAVGVVAPAVYGKDGTTPQAQAYGPLPRPTALLRIAGPAAPGGRSAPLGWVSGVAMMLRRADFVALGGFDADFTMYFEDVDLCRRMAGLGKRVAREPAAGVVHRVGGSEMSRVERTAQFQRSKAVYLEKAGATPFQARCGRLFGALRIGWERMRAPRG